MTREVAHQKSFEKALYTMKDNFPPGKLPGLARYANLYVNTSQGEGDMDGPWNSGDQWDRLDEIEAALPLDGGDGLASVDLPAQASAAVGAMADRLRSAPDEDPTTGADLGAGPGAGRVTSADHGGAEDMADAARAARENMPD